MPFSGGSGTSPSPYLIATAADLDNVRNYGAAGTYFRQIADIDLSAYANWTPLIPAPYGFGGNYDGNGYKITHLSINSADEFKGLFRATSSGSTIKNVTLENVYVTGSGISAAALAGSNQGTIDHCQVSGTIDSTGYGGDSSVGAITSDNQGTVSRCTCSVNVSGGARVGGVVGTNYASGTVNDCLSRGNMLSRHDIAGGIAGENQGNIVRCHASGSVESLSAGGGIAGRNLNAGQIKNCVALNSEIIRTSGSAVSFGRICSSANGFTGNQAINIMRFRSPNPSDFPNFTPQLDQKDGASITREQAGGESIYTTQGWDFSAVWESTTRAVQDSIYAKVSNNARLCQAYVRVNNSIRAAAIYTKILGFPRLR